MQVLSKRKQVHIALVTALCVFPNVGTGASANLVGLWEFENAGTPGSATIGNDLVLNGPGSTITAKTGPAGDGAISIGVGDSFGLAHDIAPNGGSTDYVNEYTIVYDLYLPGATAGTWRSLLQTTTTPDGNDGDYFVSTGDTVGVGSISYSSSTIGSDAWYRVVFSADIDESPSSFFTTVIDSSGNEVWTFDHANQGLDGRHSLYSTANDNIVFFFADDNGEDNELYVSSLVLFDDNLTKGQALALGAPGTAVPEPSSLALVALGAGMVMNRRRRKA